MEQSDSPRLLWSELPNFPDESFTQLELLGFDQLPMATSRALFKECLRVLKPWGIAEWKTLDFQSLVQAYISTSEIDEHVCEKLFSNGRKAVWDEKTVASNLLYAGFYKVWAGQVEGLSELEMWVKAMKMGPDEA